MPTTNKLLGMKDFFSIVLFLKLFAFFIGGVESMVQKSVSLFLIDAGVVKRMNNKFKLDNWFKRVHEGPNSEHSHKK